MANNPRVTQSQLRESLDYCPDTGEFRWLVDAHCGHKSGDIAGGSNSDGYLVIWLHGRLYKAHRLAWLYVIGEWPTHEVDHEDRNRSNNRWRNLRHATKSSNQHNACARNPASGVKGVYWHPPSGKWQVRITLNKRQKSGGYFNNVEDAKLAAMALRTNLHGEFANHG